MRSSRAGLAAVLLLVAAAAYFVFGELHRQASALGYDVYVYFLPIKIHLANSLAAGGSGLLWNPFQSCGQPFFANPTTGLLYPPHLLFLFLEPNLAVHVLLIVNIVIGALGMLLLAREGGLGWAAAVGAAVVFELGDPMAQLSGWSPTHNGPWAWFPWALLATERLLRRPSPFGIAALAAILALELAPGWVVIGALTYQVIGLRVLWDFLTRRTPWLWRSVGAIGAAMLLAPGLLAVQLLPAAELARESFRVTVEVGEFLGSGAEIRNIADKIRKRVPPLPFMAVPLLLAVLAPFVARSRRLVAFYLVLGGLYALLGFGNATPLFALYARLPPGAETFRYAHRLLWISGFSLAMLSAFAIDALAQRAGPTRTAWLPAGVAIALAAALVALVPGGLRWPEAVAVGAVLAALGAVTWRPGLARAAAWVAAAAAALSVAAVPLRYPGKLVSSVDAYWSHAAAIAALDPPLGPQDRLFIVSDVASLNRFDLIQKTATILRVPDIHDYDALLTRWHVEYITTMWHGSPVNNFDDMFSKHLVSGGFRRRLLDLAAVRYVVSPPADPMAAWGLSLPPVPTEDAGLHVFRNDSALPRARYVPRVEIVAERNALLNRLAYGDDDLATVALIEEPLESGFSGAETPPRGGSARFLRDDPEHLEIEVDAPARGFLLLADQYVPGWKATLNGAPASIHRANQMFRLIEVPAGTSRVELRYRPLSVALGAAVSLLSLALLGALLWIGRRRAAAPPTPF